jgi:hypothetical protein
MKQDVDQTELMPGTLEMLILTLTGGPAHDRDRAPAGIGVGEVLDRRELAPALQRRPAEWVKAEWGESNTPTRALYRLTAKGRKRLAEEAKASAPHGRDRDVRMA